MTASFAVRHLGGNAKLEVTNPAGTIVATLAEAGEEFNGAVSAGGGTYTLGAAAAASTLAPADAAPPPGPVEDADAADSATATQPG